jgi:hypothetical protein
VDGPRFDALARSVAASGSRRRLVVGLLGGALGLVGLGTTDAAVCRTPGRLCRQNADCCSHLCASDATGRRTCRCRTTADCPPPTNTCLAATCVPATGACTHPAKPNGAPCNDGNPCTRTDTCQNGVCTGANPVVCTALDQCHVAGTCDPATGVCTNPTAPDGTACNDHNGCTTGDVCHQGACVGTPIVCNTPPNACHQQTGTCGATGDTTFVCTYAVLQDGTACNDGDACTRTDTCQKGVCVGGNPVVCTASDQCHAAGTCDPNTGLCSNPTSPNGTACDDGNACTQTDTCRGGVCTGGNPVVCAAGKICRNGGCFTPCPHGTGDCPYTTCPNCLCLSTVDQGLLCLNYGSNAGTCDYGTGTGACPAGTVCSISPTTRCETPCCS